MPTHRVHTAHRSSVQTIGTVYRVAALYMVFLSTNKEIDMEKLLSTKAPGYDTLAKEKRKKDEEIKKRRRQKEEEYKKQRRS